MSIRFGKYEYDIWCVVFPTNVTHILLENPRLKERDAYHDEEPTVTPSLLKDISNVESL